LVTGIPIMTVKRQNWVGANRLHFFCQNMNSLKRWSLFQSLTAKSNSVRTARNRPFLNVITGVYYNRVTLCIKVPDLTSKTIRWNRIFVNNRICYNRNWLYLRFIWYIPSEKVAKVTRQMIAKFFAILQCSIAQNDITNLRWKIGFISDYFKPHSWTHETACYWFKITIYQVVCIEKWKIGVQFYVMFV
jgi:hypothetical protein